MSEFDFRCGPLLSAGTASVSLPWQRVCRRCSQRTVLVDQPLTLCLRLLVTLRSMLPRHKGTKKFIQVVPSLRGLQTRALPAIVFGGSSNRNGFRWDEQCAVPDPGVNGSPLQTTSG